MAAPSSAPTGTAKSWPPAKPTALGEHLRENHLLHPRWEASHPPERVFRVHLSVHVFPCVVSIEGEAGQVLENRMK